MPKIRAGESITIPISEEFAAFLFEGRGETDNFQIDSIPVTTGLIYRNLDNFLFKLNNNINTKFYNKYPLLKVFNYLFFRSLINNDACILLFESERNTPVAVVYGVWDNSGPRLLLKWVRSPSPLYERVAKIFVKEMKEYDASMSGKRNINTRIRTAKRNMERFNTAKEELKGIPENVMEHIIGPMMRNKTNKAAPLSRLIKNKHGGTRRRAPLKGERKAWVA